MLLILFIVLSIFITAGNAGRDVSDSHVASDEDVVASDSPSAPPPPARSRWSMVANEVVLRVYVMVIALVLLRTV